MRLVMKFGGTSVADGQKIKGAARLVERFAKEGNRIAVVVSAISRTTDDLFEAASRAGGGDREFLGGFLESLGEKHLTSARSAIDRAEILRDIEAEISNRLSELRNILTGIAHLSELTPRSLDYVLSFGEGLSTPILCGAIRDLGFRVESFARGEVGIVTDDRFGEAKPLMKLTTQRVREKLLPLLETEAVPVVAGFIATTQDEIITTLGRGGSDYTATILGAAVDADEVWIWTDVNGLMTADPKIEPSARTIRTLSFAEAMEMAYFGAKAMHPKALEPAAEKGIPVRVRNTFNTEDPGTLIVKEQQVKPRDVVKAVSIIKDVALATVAGAGMMGTPGIAAKTFGILGERNINVLMISQGSSEANISFIIPRESLQEAVNALELALLGGNAAREVSSESDICIIATVGAGMKGTPGVAAKIFQIVASEGINIRMIAQGSSELNISFVVREKDGDDAIRALHRKLGLASQ